MTHVRRLLVGVCLILVVLLAAWKGSQFETAKMNPQQQPVTNTIVQALPSDAVPPVPLPTATGDDYRSIGCSRIISETQLNDIYQAAKLYAGFPSVNPVKQDAKSLARYVLAGPFLKNTQNTWMISGTPKRHSTGVEVLECSAGDQNSLIQLLSVVLRVDSVDTSGYTRVDTVSYDISAVRTASRYLVTSIVPKGMYGGGGNAAAN